MPIHLRRRDRGKETQIRVERRGMGHREEGKSGYTF